MIDCSQQKLLRVFILFFLDMLQILANTAA